MKNRSFLGIGWAFPPELRDNTDAVTMVSDENSIHQSLNMLLSTTPGERIHRFDYGCPIRNYAFEVMHLTTQTIMKELIERAIILFEPRITLDKVLFEINEAEGVILIHLDYTIRQTNRRSNMVYPFYLNEGTEITR